MAKRDELRIIFTGKDKELFEFLKTKTSASGFLKDVVRLEMERQKKYVGSDNHFIQIQDDINK